MTSTAPTYEQTWTHEGRPELTRMGIPAVDGPWMSEPDKAHWIDPATDLDCLAVRNGMGAWCGYVAVPPGHPLHGVDYDDARGADGEWIEVHGGLTFAGSCHESEQGEGFGICHVPQPGRPDDVWWLGFDCAHAGDRSPYDAARAEHEKHRYPWGLIDGEVYRDLDYVKAECADLARQIAAVSA